jgi:hypothetical protein
MRLASVTPRSGGLAAVETFECRGCRVALMEAHDPPQLPYEAAELAALGPLPAIEARTG